MKKYIKKVTIINPVKEVIVILNNQKELEGGGLIKEGPHESPEPTGNSQADDPVQ
jgi:hypothetical protein